MYFSVTGKRERIVWFIVILGCHLECGAHLCIGAALALVPSFLIQSGVYAKMAAHSTAALHMSSEVKHRSHFADLHATAIFNGRAIKRVQLRELRFIEYAKLS